MTLLNLLSSSTSRAYLYATGRRASDSVRRELYGNRLTALTAQDESSGVALVVGGSGRRVIGVPENGTFRKLWRWNGAGFIEDASDYIATSYTTATGVHNLSGKWFIVVNTKTASAPAIFLSDNSVTGWAEVTLPSISSSDRLAGMGYSNGWWVVCGQGSVTPFVYYSSDAMTWTRASLPTSVGVPVAVGSGGGKFIVGGQGGIAYAPDTSAPSSWTYVDVTGQGRQCVSGSVYLPAVGKHVLVGQKFTSPNLELYLYNSTDAITWTEGGRASVQSGGGAGSVRDNAVLFAKNQAVFGGELYVPSSSDPRGIISTSDGVNPSIDQAGFIVRHLVGV
jgi:hypothetical protein